MAVGGTAAAWPWQAARAVPARALLRAPSDAAPRLGSGFGALARSPVLWARSGRWAMRACWKNPRWAEPPIGEHRAVASRPARLASSVTIAAAAALAWLWPRDPGPNRGHFQLPLPRPSAPAPSPDLWEG